MTSKITTEDVREAFTMSGDGLDFKKAAARRGQEFDEWLASVEGQAKAEAWDEGAVAAWERSTPTVNGTHYKWRHEGEPLNPYHAATIEGKDS